MIQDLRTLNDVVQAEFPVVPNPSTILTNVPPDATWFAFTFHGQQYLYSRLPQDYCKSPSIFNRLVWHDLLNIPLEGTLIQYVDDLLLCSPTKDSCERDYYFVESTS